MQNKQNISYSYLIKRMYPYIKPYLSRVVIAMLITIPIGALDGVIAYSLRPYMDQVMIKQVIKDAWFVPLGIVAFTLVQGILNYISTYLNGWLGQKITNNVKSDLYNKLLNFEISFFDKDSSGNVIYRFNNDPEAASIGLLNNIKTFMTRFSSSLALIFVLIYNSWKLALIAIGVLLFILIPLAKVRKRVKNISHGMVASTGSLLTHYNETFSGSRLITSYNLIDYQGNKFKTTLKEVFNLNMKITKINGWLTPFMHFIASIGIALVIWYGSHLILTGEITGGSFVSFIVALLLLYGPIKSMGNTALAAQMSFVSIERILKLFDNEALIKDSPDATSINSIQKTIKFENVWFEYEKGRPILKDVNLEVKTGETIALVGNSGGGKSTLVNLIPRFYDVTAGRITIDGVNIKNIGLKSLRDKIAVVFQDNFLFEGTIRENIKLGKLDATEDEINKAVVDAYLNEFAAELEMGLDTQIGERGVLLSGGQKQRIAIARALLKNAPVVILDEATSALDNKSEAIVQKAIERLMQNRTVFVIAHRLSTVQNAARIAVINEGQIVEIGNHAELMTKEDGIYKNLYYAQFKRASHCNNLLNPSSEDRKSSLLT